MDKSDSIKTLAVALAKAQSEMKDLKFDSDNPFYHSKYASLGAVIDASKEALKNNGFAVSQLSTSNEYGIGVTTLLMHSSGEWIESTATVPFPEPTYIDRNGETKQNNLAQEAGKTITYLRRYSLASLLNLYADEDNDGNEQPQKKEAKKEQHTVTRPMTPEMLKKAITAKASIYDSANKKVTEGQRKQFLITLEDMAEKNKDMRHAFCEYIYDNPSHVNLTDGQIQAGIDWMTQNKALAKQEFTGAMQYIYEEINADGTPNGG